MKTATITHDVNGIRMNLDGTVHHWANQSWLAESHAQVMMRNQWLEAKMKDIQAVIDRSENTANPKLSLDSVVEIMGRE